MKYKNLIINVLTTYVISFVVLILVTLFWNYYIKKTDLDIDWENVIRLALVFSIVLPLAGHYNKKPE